MIRVLSLPLVHHKWFKKAVVHPHHQELNYKFTTVVDTDYMQCQGACSVQMICWLFSCLKLVISAVFHVWGDLQGKDPAVNSFVDHHAAL